MVADAERVDDMVTVGVDEPELLLVCVFVQLLVCEPEPVRVLVDDSATEADAEFELVPLPVGVLVAVMEPLDELVSVALEVAESEDDCADMTEASSPSASSSAAVLRRKDMLQE
jgi:hypothetical protein